MGIGMVIRLGLRMMRWFLSWMIKNPLGFELLNSLILTST